MSSNVENRPGQRRGNSRRRRGGSSSGSGGSRSNSRSRSRSQSKRGENLDPRRRLDEAKARGRQQSAPPPNLWQRLVSFFTGNPAGGTDARAKTPAAKDKSAPRQRKDPAAPRSRPPEPAGPALKQRISEVSSGKLYVGNLSYDATEEHLSELFSGIGIVVSAEVVSNRRTHRSKGYAFVHMNTTDEAKRAVEILHDKDFMGRKLIVSGARNQREPDTDDDNPADNPATDADASADDNPGSSN